MSERLEEIKEIFGVHKMQTFADRKTIPFNLDDIEWLIKRVELLGKLREEDSTHYNELLTRVREQNQRYREAINNIIEKVILFGTNEEVYEAIQDAIKALEGEE